MVKRHNARVLIAEWLGIDAPQIEKHRVAASQTNVPVYRIDGVYWCAPGLSGNAPRGWSWERAGRIDDRDIYRASILLDSRIKI